MAWISSFPLMPADSSWFTLAEDQPGRIQSTAPLLGVGLSQSQPLVCSLQLLPLRAQLPGMSTELYQGTGLPVQWGGQSAWLRFAPWGRQHINEQALGGEEESYLSAEPCRAERGTPMADPAPELRNMESKNLSLYFKSALAPSKQPQLFLTQNSLTEGGIYWEG